MLKESSVRKNYFYSLLIALLNVGVPLITTPYLSRVFGASGIGRISYTQAMISYLSLLGNIGIDTYGLRQIAYSNNLEERSKIFTNILVVKAMLFVPVLAVFFTLCWLYKGYALLLLAESGYLIADLVSVDWFLVGTEQFRKLAVRGTIIKCLGVISVFAFVRTEKDIYLYELLMGTIILVGNISQWRCVNGLLKKRVISLEIIKKTLVGGILLFVPRIAGSLYLYCDKLMLGAISADMNENGYYEQSQKIVRLSVTVISTMATVMLPKISAAFSQGDDKAIRNYMTKSMKFVMFLGFPLAIGIIAVSDSFIPWFLGTEYMKVSVLLKIFAPTVIFNATYSIIGYQYLQAIKEERKYTLSVLAGGIINVFFNAILIKSYASIGASMASVFAEFTIMILQIIIARSVFDKKALISTMRECAISSALMFGVLAIVETKMSPTVINTLVLIVLGVITYFVTMLIQKNDILIETLRIVWNHHNKDIQ